MNKDDHPLTRSELREALARQTVRVAVMIGGMVAVFTASVAFLLRG
jgi:hypothetical protein